jgi:hypothetical protein
MLVVEKWRQKISSHLLLLENPFTVKNKIVIVFLTLYPINLVIRMSFALFLHYNSRMNLIVGTIFYPLGILGRFVSVSVVAVCSLTICFRIVTGIYHSVIWDFFHQEFIKQEHLSEYFRIMFMNRLELAYYLTSMTEKLCIGLALVATGYSFAKCISIDMSLFKCLVWLFWLSTHVFYLLTGFRSTLWTGSLWYVMQTQISAFSQCLTHEAEVLLQKTSDFLERQSNVENRVESISRSFVVLFRRVEHFNMFSGQISFYLTFWMTIFNGPLLFAWVYNSSHVVFRCAVLGFWCMTFASSVCVLNMSSSMYTNNRMFHTILTRLYVRINGEITLQHKMILKKMIVSAGDKRKSLLALKNIDDQVYDKMMVTRFLFYSIRMTLFLLNLARKLEI